MTALRLSDIARIVSLRGHTAIDDEPIVADEGRWALYRGENIVRRSRYPMYILYLYADCTFEAILTAAAALREPSITEVIYPPSLDERLIRGNDEIAWALRKTQYRSTTREYLFSCFEEALSTYREQIKALNPEFFVDPDTADSATEKSVSLITHFAPTNRPPVGVLIAEPGQGKTYMTRRLATRLISSGVVPIYVDSSQWSRMSKTGLENMWQVIAASFDWFEAPMPWIAGKEHDFLNVTMKAGLFTLIFDGFDEYTYRNRGRIDGAETLEALAQLAMESGARMLLTARTSFWENDIMRHGPSLPTHIRYHLRPFDRGHAKTYFDARLDDVPKANRALQLYDSLRAAHEDQGTNFVGRGFVLALLADLIDRSDGIPQVPTTDSVTRRVMYALCERERIRQDLNLTASQQLLALGTFAEQVAAGAHPTTEVLVAAIDYVVSFDDEAIRELIGDKTRRTQGKLAVHPLIEYRAEAREWRIRQDQVYYNLLAEQLLSCTSSNDPILRDFVKKILPDPKLRAEIATVVVDQACGTDSVSMAKDKVRETIQKLLGAAPHQFPTSLSMPERDLATAMAMLMVNRFVSAGRPRDERRDELAWYFGGPRLEGLQFSGTVASISFRGLELHYCRLDVVTFINCDFDETTTFEQCRFIGGRIENCDGFGKSAFTGGWRDPDASMLIESQQVLARQRPYTRTDLERDIGLLIQKFAHKHSFGTKTIEERFLGRGRFAYSPRREEIIDAFHRHVLDRYNISGKGTAVSIRSSAKSAVMFWLTNRVLTGPLARVRDEVALDLPA